MRASESPERHELPHGSSDPDWALLRSTCLFRPLRLLYWLAVFSGPLALGLENAQGKQ